MTAELFILAVCFIFMAIVACAFALDNIKLNRKYNRLRATFERRIAKDNAELAEAMGRYLDGGKH